MVYNVYQLLIYFHIKISFFAVTDFLHWTFVSAILQ